MSALLVLEGVSKSFKRKGETIEACRDVDLRIHRGEVVGLVGESGSGKSTLGNMVLGLLTPDAGAVHFDGQAVRALLRDRPRSYRSSVQAVFQQPAQALDSRRTIGWSIAEPLVIHRRGDRTARTKLVQELMGQVGLDPTLRSRRPAELSGGQLQRVNIARALALQPQLLVCDEPVSALDVSVQAQIINLLMDVQRDAATSMLFIGHDLPVVRHVSDSIAVMYGGRIVEYGPTDAVCETPRHPYTAVLMAAARDLDVGEGVEVSDRETSTLPAVGCRFAPRCPLVQERCRAEVPPHRGDTSGHLVACWEADIGTA